MPAPTNLPRERAGWPLLLTFCVIWCGLVLTEFVTDSVLPLTLGRYMKHAGMVGLVLATKPFFGFVAQPLIGIWTDRFWTPLGRRALFLLICAPVVAICLWLIPQLVILWQIVVLVVIYQLFQDIAWGSDHPLIADLIPPAQRTLLMGMILTASQLLGFAFYKYGMARVLPEHGDVMLYRIAALMQIVLVAGGALCLRERPPEPRTRGALTIRRYLADFLGHPVLRRFALLGFLHGFCKYVVVGYVVLFATVTAGLSKSAYGSAWAYFPLATLWTALPAGVLVERWIPKQYGIATGYAIVALTCMWGLFSGTAAELGWIAALLGLAYTLIEVTQKPFFTEFMPPDIIGQLSGAYNICFATGRTLAMAGAGWLITLWGDNYRLIWIASSVAAVVAMITALRIRDQRFAGIRTAPAAALQ
jgi:predicted MFS family arabinose efflux permease